MSIDRFATQYLRDLTQTLERLDLKQFEAVFDHLLQAYHTRQRIFVMGNGGSAATASHFACDINKGCCFDLEHKFKVVCLNDSIPTLTALSNDASYDVVFEEQLKTLFETGDTVIGISGSGNSPNVLRAIDWARVHQGRTIGFSGFSGGKLAQRVDVALVATVDDMQKVEDVHMIVVHMLMQALHGALHPEATAVC